MNCELCMYYTEDGDCRLRGELTPERLAMGCESFIERPFRIGGSGGCCGLSGLPFADPSPQDEAEGKA